MERLGTRGGELKDMMPDGKGRVRLDYVMPSRGLIGFRTEFMTATQGTGLIYSVFSHYDPMRKAKFGQRTNGVLIANAPGKAWPMPCSTCRNVAVCFSAMVMRFMKAYWWVFTRVTMTWWSIPSRPSS